MVLSVLNSWKSSFVFTSSDLLLLTLIAACCSVAVGIVCMNIMKKKGYDSLAGWFCCGFFLGIFGLII